MTAYTKSTNFATKDTLTSGDPLKIVKGTEINTEFDNIATAVNSKSDTASPTFTGTVTTPALSVTGASTFGTTINYGGVTLSAAVTGTGKMVLDTSPTLAGTITTSGLTASSAVATDASKALVSVTNTGSGNNVLATSPTLVTPILGTPTSATLTNATGLPLTTGVTGVLPEANGGTGSSAGNQMFKNRIINGAMVIDQRNAGASVNSNSATNPYTLDRWRSVASTGSGQFSIQQTPSATETGYATRINAGFTNYLAVTSLAATSVASGAYYALRQPIEGLNVSDFAWGTANAKTITLSFWAYSSLTGTFGGSVQNGANNRSYPFSYTISSANTWEQKTITVAGDTSGTWLTSNSIGLDLFFNLGAGATYSGTVNTWAGADYKAPTGATQVVATNGATFYITGVQLEKGSTATSFDYRPYGTELALCQRYYYKIKAAAVLDVFGSGMTYSTTQARISIPFKVSLRASPTALEQSGTASDYRVLKTNAAPENCTSVPTFLSASTEMAGVDFTVAATLVAGSATLVSANTGTTGYLAWSAEL